MTTEVQREASRNNKIAAGDARLRGPEDGTLPEGTGEGRHYSREEATLLDRTGERAIEAKDRLSAFAREHPVTTIAAGLAIGVLISGLFPRSPTRKAGAKAAGLAAIGAEAAMAYMHRALEAAGDASRAGAERLDDWGDAVGDTARHLKRDAAYMVGGASETARTTRRHAGKRLRRALRRGH